MIEKLINPILSLFIVGFFYYKSKYRPFAHLLIAIIIFYFAKYKFSLNSNKLNLLFVTLFISILILNCKYIQDKQNSERSLNNILSTTNAEKIIIIILLVCLFLLKIIMNR